MIQLTRDFYNKLGPGLLFAGAAVGVSHVVQSTSAGARFGVVMIVAILLAHLIKYPFFQFAPRYTAVTGRSLVYGYKTLGTPILLLFVILTLLTMFTVMAAVTIVAGSIADSIFWQMGNKIWSVIILAVCFAILAIGRYHLLDNLVKIIIIILSITTILAVLVALLGDTASIKSPEKIIKFSFANKENLFFLIAFLGWLPCPLDTSVWNSLWLSEKRRDITQPINYKEALLDFNIGYIGTAILAVFFLMLGAIIMHGTGEMPSPKGTVFVRQFMDMYTFILGKWSYLLVAIAAFATMFSTVITCMDGFSRVLCKASYIWFCEEKGNDYEEKKSFPFFLLFTVLGTILVLFFFMKNMGQMVIVATTISFLAAPIIAFLNYRLVTDSHFPEEYRPKRTGRILSYISLAILVSFSLWFLWVRF
jgi:Mn2+/Fe2+ NRAMP family transporter